MTSRGDSRLAGLSEADIRALIDVAIANNKMAIELAHQIAALHGITLTKPQPAAPPSPKRRGRLRYGNIIQHGPGDLTAEVVNTETGQVQRYHIVKADDGTITAEEE